MRAAPHRDLFVDAGEQDGVAVDDVAFGQHGGALQAVFQFAHVARPVVVHQHAQGRFGEPEFAPLLAADLVHQEAGDVGDVLDALAQRRAGRSA